jgi:hypothetical protein
MTESVRQHGRPPEQAVRGTALDIVEAHGPLREAPALDRLAQQGRDLRVTRIPGDAFADRIDLKCGAFEHLHEGPIQEQEHARDIVHVIGFACLLQQRGNVVFLKVGGRQACVDAVYE